MPILETPADPAVESPVHPPAPAPPGSEPEAPSRPEASAQKPAARSFAHGLNFYKLFWIFFIGCFAGVVIETIWCLVVHSKFESRQGLIYGPFNPVYGFGVLVLTVGLHWLSKKRDLWIFLGSMILGSGVEYLCSWVQETVFGTLSWQYDARPFNLNGRIDLLHSVFWGLLGLIWVKELYPRLSRLIEKIPNRWGIPLTWVLVVFMALNMVISGLAVARQTERHAGIPASNAVEVFLDRHYSDERLKKVYTNMVPAGSPPADEGAPNSGK